VNIDLMLKDFGIHMKGGVITEAQGDRCIVRTRIPAGVLSLSQLRGIVELAEKFGSGGVHLTTRQTVEFPHIDPAKLEEMAADLERIGTPVGSERDEVVNIVACPGNERCRFGNVDSISLARKIDARLFGKEMPVKMRISIAACPNACTSPMLNEVGVIARVQPLRIAGLCTGCGTCVAFCKEGAIRIKGGISVLDEEKCVACGTCVRSCPFQLLKSKGLYYQVVVGGRRGRHPSFGRELIKLMDEDQVVTAIERVVQWVYRRAWSGRLLSDQMDELQFDQFREEISRDLPQADRPQQEVTEPHQ